MRQITCYQTSDGIIHTSIGDATRHVDKCYGDLLTHTAHHMVAATNGKYGKTSEYIDKHLDTFVEMARLRDDMKLETADDD